MPNVEVAPRSRKDISKLAFEIRKILGLQNVLYIDVLKLVENILPQIWDDYCFDVCPREEMGDNHGLSINHTIQIREDVYDGAEVGEGRDRLTIIHELGHLLMHSNAPKALARGKVITYKDPEWQATAFAGEFLMPQHLVINMNDYEIACECGVSLPAAKYQLSKIKKIERS